MSWNPFKKAFSSRKSKPEDIEFEREVSKLHNMQTLSKRVYKEMRKCSDAEIAQSRANQKIISDLKSASSTRVQVLRAPVDPLLNCTERLQVESKNYTDRQDATMIDPMKKFHNVYKHLEIHTKQREAKLQEMERQQLKLDKRLNSQSVPPSKLDLTQRKFSSAKADYEKVHEKLMTEMPQLYEKRVAFFEPCVKATMDSQLLYHRASARIIQETLSHLEQEIPNQSSIEDHFTGIRALSIIGSAY